MLRSTASVALALCVLGCADDGGADGPASGTSSTSASSSTGPGSTGPQLGTTGEPQTSSSEGTGAQDGSSSSGGADGSSGGGSSSSSSTTTGGDTGLGEIMGRCGILGEMELTGEMPGFFVNTLDFGDVGWDYDVLTPGGQAIFDAGNLGGSSLYSEVVAYEVLARCEGASLVKTEGEIEYEMKGPRTDLLVEFGDTRIGVSVVRAQGFPLEDPYTVEQAQVILEDKLGDIPLSSAAVSPADAWHKQILAVVAYGPMHAQSLQTAYAELDPSLTLDTIVVVTITDGEDLFIYTE